MLIDLKRGEVVYVNDTVTALARRTIQLPIGVGALADQLPLRRLDGSPLPADLSPLLRVAGRHDLAGEALTLAIDGGSRNLWVTGVSVKLQAADHAIGLVAFFDIGSVTGDQPVGELRDRALVATQHSFTISDPNQPDDPLIYVNPAFERTTGYASHEVVNRNCRFLQGAATDPDSVMRIREALRAQQPITETLLNYRKDGTAFWNEVSISPVRDERGRLTHFVGVQSDVTARVLSDRSREDHYMREQAARADAEAARDRLEYMAEVSAALEASLEAEIVIERLGRLPVPRLGDGCVVALTADGGVPPLTHVVHRDREAQARLQRPEVGPALRRLAALAAHHRQPVVVDPDGHTDDLRRLNAASAVVVPLNIRARRLGTITLLRTDRQGPDAEELLLARELGRRAASALDNAYHYRERDHLARVLQRSLLPPGTSRLPGAEVATRYVPSGRGVEVGGDFYDVFGTAHGWRVVIGDVQGKGPDAAVVTGLARYTIRAAALHTERPAEVLSVLNPPLLQQETSDRFVTAAYLDYQPREVGARLLVTLGGHPRPLLVRDGEVRPVGEPGTLLGVLDDIDVHEARVDLLPGDAVVLVTDGVLEAPGPQGRLDEQRLADTVAAAADLDAEGIADAIVSRVLAHTCGQVPDDLAVIVLRIPSDHTAH